MGKREELTGDGSAGFRVSLDHGAVRLLGPSEDLPGGRGGSASGDQEFVLQAQSWLPQQWDL